MLYEVSVDGTQWARVNPAARNVTLPISGTVLTNIPRDPVARTAMRIYDLTKISAGDAPSDYHKKVETIGFDGQADELQATEAWALMTLDAAKNLARSAINRAYLAARDGGTSINNKPVPTDPASLASYNLWGSVLASAKPFPVGGVVFYLMDGTRFVANQTQYQNNIADVATHISDAETRNNELLNLVEAAADVASLPTFATIASGWPANPSV